MECVKDRRSRRYLYTSKMFSLNVKTSGFQQKEGNIHLREREREGEGEREREREREGEEERD